MPDEMNDFTSKAIRFVFGALFGAFLALGAFLRGWGMRYGWDMMHGRGLLITLGLVLFCGLGAAQAGDSFWENLPGNRWWR